jgi:hypothetical protein
MTPSTSPFASVNWTDIKKTFIHLEIAATASIVLALIDVIYPQIHFTGNLALFVPLFSAGVDFLRRWLTDYAVSAPPQAPQGPQA